MEEQNNVGITKKKVSEWLLEEARPSVEKFRRRLTLVAWGAFVIIGIVIGWEFGLGEWSRGLLLGGLVLNAFGAFIIAIGALPKEGTAIEMSMTKWNGNPQLLAELLKNRLAVWFGIRFILLGFLLQVSEQALRIFI